MTTRSLCVFTLLVICAAQARGQQHATSIWADIQKRGEVVAGEALTPEQARERLAMEARQIVRDRGPGVVVELIRGAGEPQKGLAPGDFELRLGMHVLIEAADPRSAPELRDFRAGTAGLVNGWPGWLVFAVVGLDLIAHPDAPEVLTTIALDEDPRSMFRDAADYRRTAAAIAMGLLRSHVLSDEVWARIDGAWRHDVASRQEASAEATSRSDDTRSDFLQALHSSRVYAGALRDADVLARYRDFERRLWRAWACPPRVLHHMRGGYFQDVVDIIAAQLKPGDERFVLRILDDTASTRTETSIAVTLVARMPSFPLERLVTIAASDSPKAPFARQALDLAARAGRQVPSTQPTTRPEDRP
jgi:hypothetical protein